MGLQHRAQLSPNCIILSLYLLQLFVCVVQIKQHNLSPALQWAEEHRAQLSPDGAPSSFEFRLHALSFLTLLTSKGQAAALQYAQQHFGAFKVCWWLWHRICVTGRDRL